VRSLRNRLIDLHDVLYGHNYDIITLTETWLSDEVTDGLLDPKGLFAILDVTEFVYTPQVEFVLW